MSRSARHRGWLFVYEAQFWIILALSVLASAFSGQVLGALIFAAFWGALIWSLYRSTNIIRRVHIGFNWLAAIATLFATFSNPPESADAPARLGEYTGDAIAIALFVVWALYWHWSARVKRAYPAAPEAEGTASAA